MTMQQWEYDVRTYRPSARKYPDVVAFLNEAGAEGWELIDRVPSSDGSQAAYYFKRPKN